MPRDALENGPANGTAALARPARAGWVGVGACALAAATLAADADAQQVHPIRCLVRDGATVAGSEGAWQVSGEPMVWSVDAGGTAALAEGAIRGDGVTTDDNGAVFLLRHDQEPVLLMREKDPVAGGFFRRVYHLSSDAAGNIVMLAEVGETVYQGNQYNGPHFQVVLGGSPGALGEIASGLDHGEPTNLRQTASGKIAFLTPGTLWLGDLETGVVPVITPAALPAGLPADATEFRVTHDRRLMIDATGVPVFAAQMTREVEDGDDVETVRTDGIWRFAGGEVSAVALERQQAPGFAAGENFRGSFQIQAYSDTGWIVFSIGVDDDEEFPLVANGIFAGYPGEVELFDPPPGSSEFPLVLGIDDEGRILSSTDSTDSAEYWISEAGADTSDWTLVAAPGIPAPGAGSDFLGISRVHLASDGTLLLEAFYAGGSGVWVMSPGQPLTPAALRLFDYQRAPGSTGRILSNCELPATPFTILPLFGSAFGAGGGMPLVRAGRFPLHIGDTCPALVALDETIANPRAQVSITMHRMGESGYTRGSIRAGLDDIDAWLVPVADPATLATQPAVARGLVVDGVTPLVLIARFDAFSEGQSFVFELDPESSSLDLRILDDSGGTSTWVPAEGQTFTPSTAENSAYLALWPPVPDALAIRDPEVERVVALRVTDRGAPDGGTVKEQTVSLRRPPVVLFPYSTSDSWRGGFVAAVEARLGDGFALPTLSARDSLTGDWALTRTDTVTQGSVEYPFLFGVKDPDRFDSVAAGFRNVVEASFNRGLWRRLVSVGGASRSTNRLGYYVQATGLDRSLPESIHRRVEWSGGSGWLDPHRLDPAARLHAVATRIGLAPHRSSLLASVGLTTPPRIDAVFPNGGDGLADRNEALFIGASDDPGHPWHSEFIATETAHTSAGLFGVSEQQSTSAGLAKHVLDILESPESAGEFAPVTDVADSVATELSEAERTALEVTAFGVASAVVDRARAGVEIIGILFVAEGNQGDADAHVRRFNLVPAPEHEIGGEVWWMAELHGPGGISTDGITLTPSGENATDLELTVAEGQCGDAVVYAGYPAADGTLVHMPPVVGWTGEPAGATMTGMEVEARSDFPELLTGPGEEPEPVQLAPGESRSMDVYTLYSDGTRLLRYVTPGDVTVVSSDPDVVDVSDPLAWVAVGPGDATVTVEAFGFSYMVAVEVVEPFPRLTFDEWKAGRYTVEELADPAVTGGGVDLDRDGLGLVLEYLTGGDDRGYDPGSLPRVRTMGPGETEPGVRVCTVRVSNGLAGVEGFEVAHSLDLAAWSTLLDLTESVSAGDERVAAVRNLGEFTEFDLVVPPGLSGFLRLRGVVEGGEPGQGTTVLTFDSGGSFDALYGVRVPAATDGGFSYGGTAASAPHVDLYYGGSPRAWASGYGDLDNVIYTASGALELRFVADPGHEVRLEGLDLAAFTSNFSEDPEIASVRVFDGDGVNLFQQPNVAVSRTARTRIVLPDPGVAARELRLRIDATNLGGESDSIGLDNVSFAQIGTGAAFGDSSLLTFRIDGFGNARNMDPLYGDRITGVRDGAFHFGGTGGFTPNVVAGYGPAGADPDHWATGYGDLTNVLIKNADGFPTLDVTLTADSGYLVRLFSFDLAAYTSEFDEDPPINSLTVLEGDDNELFSVAGPVISKDARTTYDFTAAPLEGESLTIRFDSINLGGLSDDIGIDNIHFGQVPVPSP